MCYSLEVYWLKVKDYKTVQTRGKWPSTHANGSLPSPVIEYICFSHHIQP